MKLPVVVVASVAAVAALPGCCGTVSRRDGPRSVGYALRTLTGHVEDDARTTARTLTTLHCAAAADADRSRRELGRACSIYFEGR